MQKNIDHLAYVNVIQSVKSAVRAKKTHIDVLQEEHRRFGADTSGQISLEKAEIAILESAIDGWEKQRLRLCGAD